MWQFLKAALSENGEPSSKRVISFLVALCLCFILVFAAVNYKEFVLHISDTSMVFLLILLGLATTSQILSVLKPGSKDEESKP